MKKAIKKMVTKVLHQTHRMELTTGMNGKRIINPFIPVTEKVKEPEDEILNQPEEMDPNDLFETGELAYYKKLGRLAHLIMELKMSFEYFSESEEYEVYLYVNNKFQPHYIYVDDQNLYCVAYYTDEYINLFSGSLSELRKYISSMPFAVRNQKTQPIWKP